MRNPHVLRRFLHSMHGLAYVWRTEPAFRFRVMLVLGIWCVAILTHLEPTPSFMLLFGTCGMLGAEVANTALEEVCDFIEPRYDPRIKAVKDMLSATVFLSAVPVVYVCFWYLVPSLLQ